MFVVILTLSFFLDEIEKADPQVITLLLQVLDDGRLTDGQGNTVNFKNTVIIATSNAGFGYEANLTEDADKPELMDRLKPFFRPEFLNRFNAVIEFSHLNKEDLSKIVDLMLAEVNQTLAKKDINLEVSHAAKDFITEEGYDEVMGVRPLRRVVEQQIRDKVTDFHLDHLDAKHLEADMEDGGLVIREKPNTFRKSIQTTSTSPCRTQVQPAASFLVCSLIFIEYKTKILRIKRRN